MDEEYEGVMPDVMRYKGYEGNFEFDDEARIFHGEVVGIRGVITFQSRDQGDMEVQFRDSVDVYVDFCKGLEQTPERPSPCL